MVELEADADTTDTTPLTMACHLLVAGGALLFLFRWCTHVLVVSGTLLWVMHCCVRVVGGVLMFLLYVVYSCRWCTHVVGGALML